MSTELVQLRSFYAAPGLLLIARAGSAPVGCAGLRALPNRVGEVRRLFVQPAARTRGLGRSLIEHLLAHARASGLSRLVLNTLPTMTQAIALYELLGFTPVEPYVEDPTEGVRFYALDL